MVVGSIGRLSVGRWSIVLIKPVGKMKYSADLRQIILLTKKVVKAVLIEAITLIKELKTDIII